MLDINFILMNFDYNPETGELFRVLSGGNRTKSGTECNGYIRSGVSGDLVYNHRIAWAHYYREQPPEYIDHIDGNRKNNSIKNLRACTLSENQMNRKLNSNNTTGYTGVSFLKSKGKYKATIYKKSKPIYLGLFDTAELAADAYRKEKEKINAMG